MSKSCKVSSIKERERERERERESEFTLRFVLVFKAVTVTHVVSANIASIIYHKMMAVSMLYINMLKII